MNKYIKNFRNNNLPETLFLISVFILSIGLFIEPRTSDFLGIRFYKSDLVTITTVSKIIGTLILSLSIILNLKKYLGSKNNHVDDFIQKEELPAEEEPKIDIEKIKKSLKYTGGLIYAIGWLTLVINSIYYLLNILGISLSESEPSTPMHSIFFATVVISIIYIILGKRIKILNDKKTKLYLQIVVFLSILFFILIAYTGGTVGILFIVLTIYLISSLFKIGKAMKVKDFSYTLTNPKYKLDKYGWGYFIVSSIAIFVLLLIIDSNTYNTNLSQGYIKNKPDLLYDTYLKEKEVEKTSSAWDEFDNQKKDINNTSTQINKINNSSTPNWITYTSKEEENNFSIIFPVEPTVFNFSGEYSDEIQYASGDYGVYKYIPKSKVDNTDGNLKGAPELIVSNLSSGKFISSDYSYYNNNRVFNFIGSGIFEGKKINIIGRSLIINNIPFVLVQFYENTYDKTSYLNFINSFKTL